MRRAPSTSRSSAGSGTRGRRARRSATPSATASSTGPSCTTSTSPASASGSAGRRSRRARRRASPSCSRPSPASGPTSCSRTSSSSSTTTRRRAAERRDRLDALHPLGPAADVFTGTPSALADVLEERPHTRLLPAAIPHDLHAITRGLVPELQSRGRVPRSYAAGTLRERLGLGAADEPVRRMSKRQIHLAAHFPGVNNTTVWSDPASGSHIDFASFVHLAQTAERAKFDFFFLAEGLSLREHAGHVHDLDVVGRPESFTILAALAAVTERIGLMATLTATYHEPYELARALGTLDHLSDGRAGWNLVTSTDALTGRNFSRGGYLDYGDRYVRGRELLESATQLWHSWAPGDLVADPATRQVPRTARRRGVRLPRRAGRHRGALHPAALAAGPAGRHPGGRLRRRPRVRRRARRRHLHAPRRPGGRARLLRRRQVADAGLRARARASCSSSPASPSSWATRTRRRASRPRSSVASR